MNDAINFRLRLLQEWSDTGKPVLDIAVDRIADLEAEVEAIDDIFPNGGPSRLECITDLKAEVEALRLDVVWSRANRAPGSPHTPEEVRTARTVAREASEDPQASVGCEALCTCFECTTAREASEEG